MNIKNFDSPFEGIRSSLSLDSLFLGDILPNHSIQFLESLEFQAPNLKDKFYSFY